MASFITPETLENYSNSSQSQNATIAVDVDSLAPSRFPVDEKLNAKITLHTGACYQLKVDACLIATNESFTERSGVVGDIWKAVGDTLKKECSKCDKVRTGEVAMTNSGQLPCRKLLHCVGPRYNEQVRKNDANTSRSKARQTGHDKN